MNNEEKNIHVTSFFQQGGITANQVLVGKQPRKLNDQLKANLKEMLPEDKSQELVITCVMGDPEAFQFANEIKDYLLSEGYAAKGVDQAIFSQPVAGQHITSKTETPCKITIGSNL